MTEYHIGNVGRGEVPTVTDEYLDQLHAEAKAYDARRWAAAWKERAKTWRSHYYNTRAGHLAMVAKLEAELAKTKDESEGWFLQVKVAKEDLIPRLEAAEAELAELKAQQNER